MLCRLLLIALSSAGVGGRRTASQPADADAWGQVLAASPGQARRRPSPSRSAAMGAAVVARLLFCRRPLHPNRQVNVISIVAFAVLVWFAISAGAAARSLRAGGRFPGWAPRPPGLRLRQCGGQQVLHLGFCRPSRRPPPQASCAVLRRARSAQGACRRSALALLRLATHALLDELPFNCGVLFAAPQPCFRRTTASIYTINLLGRRHGCRGQRPSELHIDVQHFRRTWRVVHDVKAGSRVIHVATAIDGAHPEIPLVSSLFHL